MTWQNGEVIIYIYIYIYIFSLDLLHKEGVQHVFLPLTTTISSLLAIMAVGRTTIVRP